MPKAIRSKPWIPPIVPSPPAGGNNPKPPSSNPPGPSASPGCRREKFHPFTLDTSGLAGIIRAAARSGATRCLMGIGGSATNDGGFGLARALGWEFLERTGQPITRWTDLTALTSLRPPRRRRWFRQLIVAVDVQNPLLGPRGATRVYGPQSVVCARKILNWPKPA